MAYLVSMKVPVKLAPSLSHPAVVGTVHSAASLEAALRFRRGECDWLELRVDNFFVNLAQLRLGVPRLRIPLIVTVRHPSEGGAAKAITPRERRALYEEFLQVAGLGDIELRQAGTMKRVISEAKAAGIGVILSHHDFARTPAAGKLRELARRARDAGADILKVAAMIHEPRELARLIEFLADEKDRLPLSVMGMGPYGKISRLVLANAGSCLNYGYLGQPNASGQWPVRLLKARIAELRQP